MKTFQKITALALMITTLLIVGCSTGTKDKIVGKWQKTSNGEAVVLEFHKDGSMLFPGNGPGKWSIAGDKLTTSGSVMGVNFSTTGTVVINGDEMTTTDDKGVTEKFKRI